MPLGIYISVPFCRSKCSFCNFASDVFSRRMFDQYVRRVCADMENATRVAEQMGGLFECAVDSIYLGGGTPSVLEAAQLESVFAAVRSCFDVASEAEITVECAPGTVSDPLVDCLLRCGVNRVSLGVQSLVDREAAAVGRLHDRATVLDDIARLRSAGIANISIDLIAGLPHQTAETWEFSLAETIATAAPHVSVYMLEVDDESRLGRELIAGGARYHAHFVPDEEAVTEFYLAACERLPAAGIAQYEISNFAREGFDSKHNLKYWTREPYLGFGVDAHSMLRSSRAGGSDIIEAVRFAAIDSLDKFLMGAQWQRTEVSSRAALEEEFFLGLRLTEGISLEKLCAKFGETARAETQPVVSALIDDGLMEKHDDVIRLTARGRLLSNEVFEKFIFTAESVR